MKNKSVSSSDYLPNGEQLLLVLRTLTVCVTIMVDQYLRTVISCGPMVLRRDDKTMAWKLSERSIFKCFYWTFSSEKRRIETILFIYIANFSLMYSYIKYVYGMYDLIFNTVWNKVPVLFF